MCIFVRYMVCKQQTIMRLIISKSPQTSTCAFVCILIHLYYLFLLTKTSLLSFCSVDVVVIVIFLKKIDQKLYHRKEEE